MHLFRFLRANRQAQLDWINQNKTTYLALNAGLAVLLLGPSMYQMYRTDKAMESYYKFKQSEL